MRPTWPCTWGQPRSTFWIRVLIAVILIGLVGLTIFLISTLGSAEQTAIEAEGAADRNAFRLSIVQHARRVTVNTAAQTAFTDCRRTQDRDNLLAGLIRASLEAGFRARDGTPDRQQRRARRRFRRTLGLLTHAEDCMKLHIVVAAKREFGFVPKNHKRLGP